MDHPQQRMPETANEIAAAVFSECLITLVRTAAMLLGKVTAPATGEPVKDLVRVQLVIQQLELLEKNAAKLSLDEQQLLKQSLQELRMAYVSAAGQRPEDALGEDEAPAAESTDTPEADSNPTESSAPSPEATAPEQSPKKMRMTTRTKVLANGSLRNTTNNYRAIPKKFSPEPAPIGVSRRPATFR